MSTPRTTLLVNASVLQELFAKNPEVEVELVKNATAQIAEVFKRKALDQGDFIAGLIREVNAQLNYKYHLPDVVIKVITAACEDRFARMNEERAAEMAQRAYDKALAEYTRKLERTMDDIATRLIEKKIAAVFAQAAKLK